MSILWLFQALRNPVFVRLYAAQTANLLGDALTWVGLALLAFELAGMESSVAGLLLPASRVVGNPF